MGFIDNILKGLGLKNDDEPEEKTEEKIEEESNSQNSQEEKIEIVIIGKNPLFEGEEEVIRKGAEHLLEIGRASDIYEAIGVYGTMFRGLKYKGMEKTEDGKTIITFRDFVSMQFKEEQEREAAARKPNENEEREL